MIGIELLLFGLAWLCLKAFRFIAKDKNCSLRAREKAMPVARRDPGLFDRLEKLL
jgi:hypothetical protein